PMGIQIKQNLKLSTQLVMTPQLQQAIKLLQLSRAELLQQVRQEMDQNPLLEQPEETTAEEDLAEQEPGEASLEAENAEQPKDLEAPASDNGEEVEVKANAIRPEIDW